MKNQIKKYITVFLLAVMLMNFSVYAHIGQDPLTGISYCHHGGWNFSIMMAGIFLDKHDVRGIFITHLEHQPTRLNLSVYHYQTWHYAQFLTLLSITALGGADWFSPTQYSPIAPPIFDSVIRACLKT